MLKFSLIIGMIFYSLRVLLKTYYGNGCEWGKKPFGLFLFSACWVLGNLLFQSFFFSCLKVVAFPKANKIPFERDLELMGTTLYWMVEDGFKYQHT